MSNKDCLTGISDLIERLRKRSEIRLGSASRKSVQENKPDRISELLQEAANKLEEIADELIDTQTRTALKISKLEDEVEKCHKELVSYDFRLAVAEQELARIKGLTMEYS